jgi:hypothetical protein
MKKESIEEVAERLYPKDLYVHHSMYQEEECDRNLFERNAFIDGYNYSQQEISELKNQRDEMLELLSNINACIGNEYRLPFWIESKLKQY